MKKSIYFIAPKCCWHSLEHKKIFTLRQCQIANYPLIFIFEHNSLLPEPKLVSAKHSRSQIANLVVLTCTTSYT